MRHIAVRSRSVHSSKPFTATGLGDRIHLCTVAWVLAPCTLHLTADKWRGGQFGNKPESWREVVSLFPEGSVALQVHPVEGLPEDRWLAHLRKQGIDAEPYWHGDFPGPLETPVPLDIAPYLKRIPLLTAEAQDVSLPERFCTAQWDSTSRKRSVPVGERPKFDLPELLVGGEAKDPFRWSLKAIAYAMSKADFHAGVDSAFMHMARLFMQPDRIRLYGDLSSHHARRA